MAKILVAGLNPAWQTVLGFSDFLPGEVNRAQSRTTLASGKGFNAGKVLKRLGHDVSLLQVLGGDNGRKCLAGCEALGLRSLHAWVETETRQCITLLHREAREGARLPRLDPDGAGAATEIIEPFHIADPGVTRRLLETLPSQADAFDALVLCGTVPSGAGEGLYDTLLARYRPSVSVVDAWQGMRPDSLAKATCLKVNRTEYAALKRSLGDTASAQARFLLTSGGGEACVLLGGERLARISPPVLPLVVNPIGAGDTVTAAVTHFLLAGLDMAEAFRRALAFGSASCLERLPAEYRDEEVERLLPLARTLA